MKKIIILVIALIGFNMSGFGQVNRIGATDNNWSVSIDLTSDLGLDRWTSPGNVDYMYQEWWWVRSHNDSQEYSLDTLTRDNAFNPTANTIQLEYSNNLMDIDVTYTLNGGINGSTLMEQLLISNTSTSSDLIISIYEYTDLELAGTFAHDYAQGGTAGLYQWEGDVTAQVIPLGPVPSHFQIGAYPGIRNLLQDGSVTLLNDSGSPFGPGDATFAFQWDFLIGAGGSVLIEKEKAIGFNSVIPEPTTMLLLGSGLLGLGGIGFRKRNRKQS